MKKMRQIVKALLLASTIYALPMSAYAKDGIDMSTSYPGISVKAGENVSFELDFDSLTGDAYDAGLTVEEIPEGWTGYFKGSSNEITSVHINGGDTENGKVTFNTTLPKDAKEGDYKIRLKANASGEDTDELTLTVTVTKEENGQSSFTAEYPEQQGATGTTFNFNTTLVNNRLDEQSYSLSASTAEGWQVSFTPSSESTNVTSLTLDGGKSETVKISVTPPDQVAAGEYEIPVTAVSANDQLDMTLKVIVTGTYSVALSTPTGNLATDAYANEETPITLTVTNTGNVDLDELTLSSSTPTDWNVSFDTDSIDHLAAGETREITARLVPSKDAITGDYQTNLTVSNSITSSTAAFRVSVKTKTTWGITAVAIVVALLLALAIMFKKFGRR